MSLLSLLGVVFAVMFDAHALLAALVEVVAQIIHLRSERSPVGAP